MSTVRHAKPGILARLTRKQTPAPAPAAEVPPETIAALASRAVRQQGPWTGAATPGLPVRQPGATLPGPPAPRLEYPPAGLLRRVAAGLRALDDPLPFDRYPVAATGARVPADCARDLLRRVRYPAADGTPERYAAVMRHVSAMTGTTSLWERPAAWSRHEIETGGMAS